MPVFSKLMRSLLAWRKPKKLAAKAKEAPRSRAPPLPEILEEDILSFVDSFGSELPEGFTVAGAIVDSFALGGVEAGAAAGAVGAGVVTVGAGIVVAAVAVVCAAVYAIIWATGGFALPESWWYWTNEQELDLKDGPGKKTWLFWTEEGSGRFQVYPYATREDLDNDTGSWFVDRVLFKWDETTGQPKEYGAWGAGFAHNSIRAIAAKKMHEQYQANVNKKLAEKGLDGKEIDKAALAKFCADFQAWSAAKK